MKVVFSGLVILAASIVLYHWSTRPAQIPPITLQDETESWVSLDQMQQNKEHLLVVFVLPGCPLSRFSLSQVQSQLQSYSDQVAIVAWMFSNQAAAVKFRQQKDLPFPVYGLHDAQDPLQVNELIEAVGSAHGLRDAIYGGTILVIDTLGNVELKLEKEEVRRLPEHLLDLVST